MTDLAMGWLSAIIRASWHGCIAVASIWLVTRLHFGLSPRAKMRLLRLAYLVFLGDLALPALSLSIMPAARTPLTQPVSAGAYSPLLHAFAEYGAIALISVWILCAVFLLIKMFGTIAASVRTSRRWAPITDEHGQRSVHWLCRRICNRMGISRIPRLSTGGDGGPALVGFVNPVIMVPASVLSDCDQRELELVLAHELAHLCKGDLVWNLIAALADALFFFIPPLRWASREMRIAQEMDADAIAVAATESQPSEYGALLIRLSVENRKPSGELLTAAMSSLDSPKMRLVQLAAEGKANLASKVISSILGVILVLAALPVEFSAKTAPTAVPELSSIGNGDFVYSYSDGSGKRFYIRTNKAVAPPVGAAPARKVLLRLPAPESGKRLFLVRNNVVYRFDD